MPGFIDVHVHGVAGIDALDGDGAVAAMAGRLPRFGVTAFCPATTACAPAALERCLLEVGRLRAHPAAHSARVIGAHVESNFINPDYRGAQPLSALRTVGGAPASPHEGGGFSGRDAIAAIDRHRQHVAILTLAPEIDGGLELLKALVASGLRVSLGHSGATFDRAEAAIAAGARHATHLFNAMAPFTHRAPGLAGAVLASRDVAAEIICDGHHVHPAVVAMAIAAKGVSRMMAVTDGTAGSGLPPGSRAQLGGQPITVAEVARLDDGTIAGSVLTMDRAFACLVTQVKLDLVQASHLCATTPARELGLRDHGAVEPGNVADLVALDDRLGVAATWISGERVWEPPAPGDRLDRT